MAERLRVSVAKGEGELAKTLKIGIHWEANERHDPASKVCGRRAGRELSVILVLLQMLAQPDSFLTGQVLPAVLGAGR